MLWSIRRSRVAELSSYGAGVVACYEPEPGGPTQAPLATHLGYGLFHPRSRRMEAHVSDGFAAETLHSRSTPVSFEVRRQVALITISRPAAHNALTTEVLKGIALAMDMAETDAEVRAVVLTGGSQAFASGADIRELRERTPASHTQSDRLAAWHRFARFPKPTVAAVAGYVLGGGCELAMGCDFIVAGDNAVLGQPEIILGILPGAGGTQRWARVEGRFRAAEHILAARKIDAWTAERNGLVNVVVPAERVVQAGMAMAESVAALSPMATRMGKAALRASEELPLTAGMDYEQALFSTLLSTEDHREGVDAFLEKRPAEFKGR